MNQRLVIFDIDGTLVKGAEPIPQSTIDTVRRIRANGDIAIVFTGRPYTNIDPRVLEIGFDAEICTMGAFIKIGDEVARDIHPEQKATKELIRIARECRLDFTFESGEGICFDLTRPLSPFLSGLKKHFSEMGLDTDKDIDKDEFTYDKMCVFFTEDGDTDRFEKEATKYLKIIGKKQNMEELTAKGVSVEDSVNFVADRFGIPQEERFAIGDSINDLPMLKCAAHTAAMGDGSEELKPLVDYVTTPLQENGIENAMKHFGLI